MELTEHNTESVYRRCAIVAEVDLRVGVAKLTERLRAISGLANMWELRASLSRTPSALQRSFPGRFQKLHLFEVEPHVALGRA
jgi:hypothetical protein